MEQKKPNENADKKPGALPPLSSGPASGGSNLPSFKSSLSKKKSSPAGKSAAVVPTWGSAGVDKLAGAPMFRGAAALAGKKSLMGRLKGLKTKDIAFIAAGLGVLVMAPLAEYLISEPADGGTSLSEGFDRKGGFFAEPQDLYEAGMEGIAPGGLMGRDTDVITPLNVRDPSSLIMGPGGMEEKAEPVASIPKPDRDAPKDDTDWKKIIDSAKSGVKEATKKVKLPRPGGKLAGALSGLKGLAGGGSTRASLALGAPRTPGSSRPSSAGSNLSRTQGIPGFRGAGGRSLSGSGRDVSGGFGRASNPGGTTGQSASSYGGINGGGTGTGFGRPNGDGTPTKSPGGSNTKDNKTLGENLEFLRAKMNMEKAIDLKWAKKRYNELERKKMLEQLAAQTAQQVLLKILDRLLKGSEGEKGGGGSGGGSGGGGGDPAGDQGTKDDAAKEEGGLMPNGEGKLNFQRKIGNNAKEGVSKGKETIGDAKKAIGNLNGSSLQGSVAKANAALAAEPNSETLKELARVANGSLQAVQKAQTKANEVVDGALGKFDPIEKANEQIKTKLDTFDKPDHPANEMLKNADEAKGKLSAWTNTGTDPVTLSGASGEMKTVQANPDPLGTATPDQSGDINADAVEAIKSQLRGLRGGASEAYAGLARGSRGKLASVGGTEGIAQNASEADKLITTAENEIDSQIRVIEQVKASVAHAAKLSNEAREAYNAADGKVAEVKSAYDGAKGKFDSAKGQWQGEHPKADADLIIAEKDKLPAEIGKVPTAKKSKLDPAVRQAKRKLGR